MTTEPLSRPDYDAIVVGAGFAGLYMLHKLRTLGLSAVGFEAGAGVGGTWYWNKYPGARCDVHSMEYSFSFSDELQQEWEWSERYPAQAEILRYMDHVADRFDLRRDIRFDTRVVAAAFDERSSLWHVTTDKRDVVSARYCIMASGALSAARTPDFDGLADFRGEWFHTGHWPDRAVNFGGCRVAVIGTGSSGIQIAPVIAEQADHLTVLQRTANFSIPAWNRPLSRAEQDAWKKDYPALRATAKASRSGALYDYGTRSAFDDTAEQRQHEFDARWARGGPNFVHAYKDLFTSTAANDFAADYVRDKIRGIVNDPAVSDMLMPTDHAIGTKRICVDSAYFDMFNRPNVTLVDVHADPITHITPTGIATTSAEYDVDMIVFATGYDAVTGALTRIDIAGRGGRALRSKWSEGPSAYLGLMVSGFPNLFTITGPGSPSILTNVVMAIEQHVEWIADCLAYMRDNHFATIEAEIDAEAGWVDKVRKVAEGLLHVQANSWYMGANIPGKPRIFLPFAGGLDVYTTICRDVADDGYRGFRFDKDRPG